MFCPFCGNHFSQLARFCFSCGKSLEFLKEQTEETFAPTTSKPPGNTNETEQPCSSYKQFMEYKNIQSKERLSFTCGPKRRPKQERRQVQINIGLMVPHGCDLKPVRGKTLPLFTDTEITAPDLLKLAVQKMRVFNKDMDEGPYVLLYPDCSEVVHVPGTERPFILAEYKKEIGKTYCRISFFLCLEIHLRGVDVDSESDSDSEIVITTRSRREFTQADTVVFDPQNQSTPNNKPAREVDAMGHSSTVISGQIQISDSEDNLDPPGYTLKSTCYSKYTNLYAPCVEEEDEEPVPVKSKNIPDKTMEEESITLQEIITNLSLPIDHGRVSRFNISRSNIWDGAVRGFKRGTYSEASDMLVRFTDDAGVFEDGIDAGGPRTPTKMYVQILFLYRRPGCCVRGGCFHVCNWTCFTSSIWIGTTAKD